MSTPAWVTASALVAPVAALTGGSRIDVTAWRGEPIAGGMGETIGVWRVLGAAEVDGASTAFTLILKGWAVPDDAGDPQAWNWPLRELRAYASGALDDLPGGVTAPRCLGEMTPAPGEAWAWLTPMSTDAIANWDLELFALVARHLGRFNGAYLTGTPLPDGEWVSRNWTRGWTEAASETIANLDAYLAHPLLAKAFPAARRDQVLRLWDERAQWYAVLASLPTCFGHLDAFKRNVFVRPGPDGALAPGLIDWGFAGACAVGEEIAPLVSASIVFGEAPDVTFEALDAAVFEGYVTGLRDAGWDGDDRLARIGYAGSLVMRYLLGPLRLSLPLVANEALHPIIEQAFGCSVTEFLDRGVAHTEWALGLADEFRRLTGAVAPLPDAA